MTRDRVRIDRQAQQVQAVIEIRFPDRLVPFDLRRAEDVVDQDVQPALLALDARDERPDLLRIQMVHLDRNAATAGSVDESGGFLDRLGSIHLRALATGRASGAVNRGAACAELNCDPAAGAARRSGHQRDLAR